MGLRPNHIHALLLTVLLATAASTAYDQVMAPTNSLPNPYRSVENWAKLPDGRIWGSTSGVDVDPDGQSVWVLERCSAQGFIPPSQVSSGTIVQGTPCAGCVLPSSTITINDVIALNGARNPDWRFAKHDFRIATVVISRDRLLTDDEMSVLEYFAARGEGGTALPYTSGLARGTTKPFYVATRGLGRVDFRLDFTPRRRAAKRR